MKEVRVMPMPHVHPVWEHDDSKYPETIKVSMSNGKVIRYRIDIEQPHPCFLDAMVNIERMKAK